MANPASPELIGEVDAALSDVYRMVIEEELDEDMDEYKRSMWYFALRMAYAQGKLEGAQRIQKVYKDG